LVKRLLLDRLMAARPLSLADFSFPSLPSRLAVVTVTNQNFSYN
jgi:hypothetical protein